MKKFLLTTCVLLLAAALPVSCSSTKTPVASNLKEVVITLERTACFGVCPVYTLTVYGNGAVIYEGKRFVKTEGVKTNTITEERVRQLVSEFVSMDYFSLKDSYEELMATDLPSVITSITIDGQTKTVRHYHGDFSAPRELTELENRIDEIVNSGQWIK